MSLNLDIPGDLEAFLQSEATKQGLMLPDYILKVLSSSRPATATTSGKHLVEYWTREGLVGARADIADSEAHSRALRARAERRDRS